MYIYYNTLIDTLCICIVYKKHVFFLENTNECHSIRYISFASLLFSYTIKSQIPSPHVVFVTLRSIQLSKNFACVCNACTIVVGYLKNINIKSNQKQSLFPDYIIRNFFTYYLINASIIRPSHFYEFLASLCVYN